MRTLIAATDLSSRSDRALHRAALLASQFKARLCFLHAVDDDQPPTMIDQNRRQATALLAGQARHLSELTNVRPDVVVKAGDPFDVIVEAAREQGANLIVMGAHRK